MSEHLVIVGASYAGFQLAASARSLGYEGAITLLGDEPGMPYQRPPLSKAFLKGEMAEERLAITGPDFFSGNEVRYLPGVRATGIRTEQRMVELSNGEELTYSWLALCTGAHARPLPVPGFELPGVHTLRSLADARAIMKDLAASESVCVIGAGFIGLEVAAACRQLGKDVTVLEAGEEVLARALPGQLRRHLQAQHEKAGVKFRFSAQVRSIEAGGTDGRLTVVTDNDRFSCDTVVAGIGAVPNKALAEAAGIHCAHAVLVDASGRTSVPGILAAGDCAAFPCDHAPVPGESLTLESIQAAKDTARAAASVVAGNPQPFREVPWFWTDQYDLKVQIAGLCSDSQSYVERGDCEKNRFSLVGMENGRVRSVCSVNRPADHMAARKLIARKVQVTEEEVVDVNIKLKALLEK